MTIGVGFFKPAAGGGGGSDPHFANVVLLNHCNGANGANTFIDSSSYARALSSVGTAKTDTSQKKFGSASADTGGGPVVAATAPELVMGTADFTAELWLYQSTLSTLAELIGQENNTGTPGRWFIGVDFSDPSKLTMYVDGSDIIRSATGVLVANTWQHIAYSRSAGVGLLFVDGIVVGGVGDTNNYSAAIQIRMGGSIVNVTGFTDDYRLTKGVGRYTANFTPPTAQFPDS